ncbi:nuclear transcription factor Y subunit B-4-like [Pistacia vera]|uniref:nuclear transcription factor Y subunit B-4-like n=1 Tax=Pistacia vera TaxID=55513 RepID=UPI0012633864|nr:nuclear transcription factor Y subunit B-4-like [Pistacia vera]
MTGKRNQSSPIGSPSSGNISDSSSKEHDRFLPIANVSRIMKKALPANAKISKEAKDTVQECVSEFISFITGEASDKCQREKRKTINGDDLLWAMTTLGFENYVGTLKTYLNKYRETEGEKNLMPRQDDHHQTLVTSMNHEEIHKMNGSLSVSKADFQNFNMGFYSLGAQAAAKSIGEGTRVISYGENLGTEGFNFSRIHHENGEGNGNRAALAAAHVHGGVDW